MMKYGVPGNACIFGERTNSGAGLKLPHRKLMQSGTCEDEGVGTFSDDGLLLIKAKEGTV